MGWSQRRTAGIVTGALVAAPVIALLGAPSAGADATDDLITLGPYTIDGFNDTLTYDATSYAFDNYTTGTVDGYPVDFDIYQGPAGSGSLDDVFTIPLLFQAAVDEVDGVSTPSYSFDAFDFVSPDAGLVDIGGTGAPATGIVTLGPFSVDGDTDTASVDQAGAFDNYVVGTQGSLTYDLDVFSGAPGSNTSEILFTVPSVFQVGIDDVAGTITPLASFSALDAINPDVGLIDLAGL